MMEMLVVHYCIYYQSIKSLSYVRNMDVWLSQIKMSNECNTNRIERAKPGRLLT